MDEWGEEDIEQRKLDALVAISGALETLGPGLVSIAQDSSEQVRLLQTVDGKIDRLTQMVSELKTS